MLVRLNKTMVDGQEQLSPHFQSLFDLMVTECKAANIKNCPEKITDLPTYYRLLQEVRGVGEYALLRIPEEEQLFEINANTRKINIPDHFAKNGLGVQGDHTAEVIFFRINRYFDEMDLSLCSGNKGACYIQWSTGDNARQQATKAYAFDVTENHIIFGWVISNKATKKAGKLNFSVRFVQWEDDPEVYTYSWSTLTATCNINPALNFSAAGLELEDLSDIMQTRRVYSNIINTSSGALPIILANLVTEANYDEGADYATLSVRAQAHSGGNPGDTLEFTWYGPEGQILTGVTNTPEEVEEGDPIIMTSTYKATQVGVYYVAISNIKVDEQGTEHIRTADSNGCTIPEASDFELIPEYHYRAYNLADNEFKVAVKNANGKVNYQWMYSPNNDGVFTAVTDATTDTFQLGEGVQEGFYYCKVENVLNGDIITKETGLHAEVRNLPNEPEINGNALAITISKDNLQIGFGVFTGDDKENPVDKKDWEYIWKVYEGSNPDTGELIYSETGYNLPHINLVFESVEKVPAKMYATASIRERIWPKSAEERTSDYVVQSATYTK